MLIFGKIILTSAKLRANWYQKVYFLKLDICVYLCTKFQVSSTILTTFRQGVILLLPPPQKEPLKTPPRLGLNIVAIMVFKCCESSIKSNIA